MIDHEVLQTKTRATEFFEYAINGLRQQVWLGFLLFWLVGVTATRLMRYNAGVEATPATITMMIVIYSVILAALWFRKSRYAQMTQTAFLLMMHIMVPVGLFFYGSIQGFGDLALYTMMIISLIFDWRWWMYLTFGSSLAALMYAYYATITGLPTLPFLEYTPLFSTIKVLLFSGVIGFTIYYGNRFYRSLLNRHQQFAEEQVRLTEELQASDRELRQLTQEIMTSRQQIVFAQDEERMRLRRDLTDDLGPKLAGLILQAGAAQQFLPTKQDEADKVLADLERGIEEVLGDVRHFVYALRPPLLDQLGLLGAIREIAKSHKPLEVDLVLPEPLRFGAATEVACFKIVQATLAHIAQTKTPCLCTVTLTCGYDENLSPLLVLNQDKNSGSHTEQSITDQNEDIILSVCTDDVEHLVDIKSSLPSMEAWAEELTGTLEIRPHESGGSCLYAQLPNTLNQL